MWSLQITSVEWGLLLPGSRPQWGDAHHEGETTIRLTGVSEASSQCQEHLQLWLTLIIYFYCCSCQVPGTSQWDLSFSLWESCSLNPSWSWTSGCLWMEPYLKVRSYWGLNSRQETTHTHRGLLPLFIYFLTNWKCVVDRSWAQGWLKLHSLLWLP